MSKRQNSIDDNSTCEKEENASNKRLRSGSQSKSTEGSTSSNDSLVGPSLSQGEIKILSWNVNSLPAAIKKGCKDHLIAENPHILCLQETKLNSDLIGLFPKEMFPFVYFAHSTSKKGYSGSAVFSKIRPESVKYGLPGTDLDDEGRLITLTFSKFFLVATYMPNAGQGLKRLSYKQEWDKQMKRYLNELDQRGMKEGRYLIWAGDLNVAHQPIDLARPKGNEKTPGYTPEERADFTDILNSTPPLIDTFRHLNPESMKYSYFSYRFQCRSKNIGWRLDYFVTSERLVSEGKVITSDIRTECYGASDHVPIILILKGLVSTDSKQDVQEDNAKDKGAKETADQSEHHDTECGNGQKERE